MAASQEAPLPELERAGGEMRGVGGDQRYLSMSPRPNG